MSAPTDRPDASPKHQAAPTRDTEPATTGGQHSKALVVLVIAVVVMAVLPDLVDYLNVKHAPATVQLRPRFPLAVVVTRVASIALFLVCSVIALRRGHPDRNISGAVLLLSALIVPFIFNPELPGLADIARIALAAVVILAVWNIGASVDGLRWVAITGSFIGVYSIIGVLIIPDYMNFESDSRKSLIENWQLAGPFAHSNTLGAYCVLALALTPLIVSVRWKIFHGLILCTAIAASASRTALIAAGVLALWWIFCRFRSVIALRRAGTVLIGACAAVVLVLPVFLSSNPSAITGRGYAWATSLSAWQESRLVGLGLNWFATTRTSLANSTSWAFPTGHNLFVDTLVRSGLVGIVLLALVLLAATRATRALEDSNHQIACFGFIIAFLVVSTTEAIWGLLPNMALFPVVGLVFAVLIVARHGVHAGSERMATPYQTFLPRASFPPTHVGRRTHPPTGYPIGRHEPPQTKPVESSPA